MLFIYSNGFLNYCHPYVKYRKLLRIGINHALIDILYH